MNPPDMPSILSILAILASSVLSPSLAAADQALDKGVSPACVKWVPSQNGDKFPVELTARNCSALLQATK